MKKQWIASALLSTFPLLGQASFIYYAGIAGGGNFNSAQMSEEFIFTQESAVQIVPSQETDSDQAGPVGQLQLGAGYRDEYFYIGLELLGQLLNGDFDPISADYILASPDVLENTIESKLSLNNAEVAIDLKPGVYLFEHTLLYGRIGIGINEFHLEQNAYNNLNGMFTVDNNTSKTVYPVRFGLGLERHFDEELSVFMDYVYVQYPDITETVNTTTGTTHLYMHSEATDISRQTIMLGLNYYF